MGKRLRNHKADREGNLGTKAGPLRIAIALYISIS